MAIRPNDELFDRGALRDEAAHNQTVRRRDAHHFGGRRRGDGDMGVFDFIADHLEHIIVDPRNGHGDWGGGRLVF